MTTYYVDNAGNDASAGTSLGAAWQHCSKVNSFATSPGFAAGDCIVFTAGQTFVGPLTLTANNGTAGSYICIGTGRHTNAPSLPSGGIAQSNPAIISIADGQDWGIRLWGCEYTLLDNIEVRGSGVNLTTGATTATALGISIKSTGRSGTEQLRGVMVTACSVTGCYRSIIGWSPASQPGFDGLYLWGCVCHANLSWGIMWPFSVDIENGGGTGSSKTHSQNIYIGYCQVYDTPGNATHQSGSITSANCTNVKTEYCVVHDVTWLSGLTYYGSPGFEVQNVDQATIQYCEAYKCHTNTNHYDGEGFDEEPNCTNVLFQYCYAHDNDGPGFLIRTATVRFCVSSNNRNDPLAVTGTETFWALTAEIVDDLGGPTGVAPNIYGNTVYAPNCDAFGIMRTGSFGTNLYNNVLISKAGNKAVNVSTTSLRGNIYAAIGNGTVTVTTGSGTYTTIAALRTAGYETGGTGYFGDPLLSNPSGAPSTGTLPGANVSTLAYWDLESGSPARNEAVSYSALSITPGPQDFRDIAYSLFTDAGACQYASSVPGIVAMPMFG